MIMREISSLEREINDINNKLTNISFKLELIKDQRENKSNKSLRRFKIKIIERIKEVV